MMSENKIESLASDMRYRYPGGYLSGIVVGWPCKIAVRGLKHGIDSPLAVVEGSYQELMVFERVYGKTA
jgi:hypothetical protein